MRFHSFVASHVHKHTLLHVCVWGVGVGVGVSVRVCVCECNIYIYILYACNYNRRDLHS